ncbi:hypothetical protein Sste5346_010006 [Sporothrix stenoceras]|uniref:Nineteen complex-related protein 2-domain-containing protein n=1 Tax=Sporothrix stenoceras TaxID=5173 RepID=A0ABR3YIU3_9PEZI
MSLFTKRKGRRISTFDDDDEPQNGSAPGGEDQSSDPVVQPIRFGKRPLKQSALRRSINIAGSEDGLGGGADLDESSGPTTADVDTAKPTTSGANDGGDNGNEDDGPVVVRPALGRSGSRKNRKRLSTASTSSRLSFGGMGGGDDDEDDDGGPVVVTPNKRAGTGGAGTPSLTQRVLETNAFRKSLSGRLPTRHRANDSGDDENPTKPTDYDDDDDRPRYSQAYLDELQSSTPNTPQNLASQRKKNGGSLNDDDVMDLDPSELDGAMVVDASELGSSGSSSSALAGLAPPPPAATVLTATEIRERKDRRARRALEADAMADDEDEAEANGEYISLLTDEQKRKKKEKEMTRLVREDEDLGEGFDEFVEEKEALSIGRKAERAARKKRKEEMAALINAAEAGDDADGDVANNSADDSEAERRAAYDAAQTRAGMDGLQKTRMGAEDDGLEHGVQGTVPIPKMRPLPDLATCLQQMQSAVAALEVDAAQHRRRLAEVEQEKNEIAARETEVQAILDAAAAKYQTVLGGSTAANAGATSTPGAGAGTMTDNTQSPLRAIPNLGQSPLRSLPPGLAGDYPVQRGLESLGATPTRRPNADDFF